ncbi:uncharacterized protein [Halyomorpha halys]|uniref:uncharacterized protein isoform X2 n=1 Tax=Halyomorpha halys TaxID=286706 RepID=UPI0006D4E79D|nr:uncharacterized protein LOC106689734 isoform X2 [Halyomorpha halys]
MSKKNKKLQFTLRNFSENDLIFTELPKIDSKSAVQRKDENCLQHTHRFHNAFLFAGGERYCLPLAYQGDLSFPLSISCVNMKNKVSKYLWNLRCLPITSDSKLFYNLCQVISKALKKLEAGSVFECEVLILNDILGYYSSLHQTKKYNFIQMISRLLSYPNNVKWISAENEFLCESDGLRLLLVFSIGTGKTLEYLHIWNFFRNPGFNSYSHSKEGTNNFSNWRKIAADLLDLGFKTGVWDSIVSPLYMGDIPEDFRYFAYYLCLCTLKNLNTLSIKYSMLAGGKGESLCHLECIKNGRLKVLNLLCTQGDMPRKTSQLIYNSSWMKALIYSPLLKVNLVIIQVIRFDELKHIFQEKMPLQGFHLSCTGIPINGWETDTWLLDHTIKLMLNYYLNTLKRISLELWYTPSNIDSSVTKLISTCQLLEEFEYRGTFDNIATVEDICEFYVTKNTRIRKLYLLIREDPCCPDYYKKTLKVFQSTYEGHFINNGIDFLVSTCKI